MVKLPMGMRSWLWRARTAWWEPVAGPQSRCGSLPAAMLLLLLSTCRHNQGEFGKYRMYFQVAKEGTEIQLPCSISISLHQPFYSQSIWTSALLVWDPPIIVWPELTVVWTELSVEFRLALSNWKIRRSPLWRLTVELLEDDWLAWSKLKTRLGLLLLGFNIAPQYFHLFLLPRCF